ncbi:MAG: hypothetical protein QXR97_04200 [Thermoproteota archaeon]
MKRYLKNYFSKKVIILFLLSLITIVLILCFTLPYSLFFNEQAFSKFNIKDLVILYIGDNSNEVLNNVLNRMQQLGVKQTKRLEIQSLLSNNTLESIKNLNEKSLVIFDGYWISERVNDPEIHVFLRKASYQKARFMAIDGPTSKFFEALDKAGINKLGRDENGNIRNPAYNDPPFVGFTLKEARTPDGHSYFYPSIFISNTTTEDINAMVQELINWLGG